MLEPLTAEDVMDCWRYGLLPLTILREAGGEPFPGKVAVAEVILNRAADPRWEDNIDEVILHPLQFSSFNRNDPVATRMPNPTSDADRKLFHECCLAAAEALAGSAFSGGANHYLNPVRTRKIRGGTLPSWYDPSKVTAVIANHEFLKL